MPTPSRLTPKLKATLRWLRKHYRTATPIIVRVVKSQPGLHGLCLIGDGRALIRITSDSEQVMVDVLLEEYCHVLRSECPVPVEDDHDSIFWALLGQVTMHWRGPDA